MTKREFKLLRVSPETYVLVIALEEAAMGLGGAERKGDIDEAYGLLNVTRARLYERIQHVERAGCRDGVPGAPSILLRFE